MKLQMVLKILLVIRFYSMILFYYIYILVYEYITTLVTTVYCHTYTYVVHSAHTGTHIHIYKNISSGYDCLNIATA